MVFYYLFRNLHFAILCGYVEESKRLIENCPESNLLDIQNYDGQVCLFSFTYSF